MSVAKIIDFKPEIAFGRIMGGEDKLNRAIS